MCALQLSGQSGFEHVTCGYQTLTLVFGPQLEQSVL